MIEKEQLHDSGRLPHQVMWQSLDKDIFIDEKAWDDATIISIFEAQAKKHPEKTVVLFRDQVLTYGQLDHCATALGQQLCHMGIGVGDCVGILAQRSLEMVVAVYGVLKAGAAYVPIDIDYPPERITYILEDSAPKAVLLYGGTLLSSVPQIDLTNILSMCPHGEELPRCSPDDLAYLIYTSGTSGKPKGVMIEHRNVVNYSLQNGEGVLRYLPEGEGDTIVSLTNFVFDIFVTELLMAPMLGMTVILADDREQVDAEALQKLMERHPAAIMQTTPSRVQLYLSQNHGEQALQSFSYMMLGGEAVSPQLVQRLHRINPAAKIIDVYGPSETTVWSTCADVTHGDVTIGTPITGTQVYILDGMEPCPVGVPGELCIGGRGVARGYLNRPELTAEKFIPNPFGMGRLYRTGDLAQWREDGNLAFLGRIDDQVKIRGTRIELGEIDAALREVFGVRDCAVIAREDSSGQKELYAYIVSDHNLNLHNIRRELGGFLPESMIPAYFAQIDKIPLNANGKLDKKALPTEVGWLSDTYVEPVTLKEKKLCSLFEEILDIQPVGATDHFFQMGGHSFRSIRLRNRIEEEFGCVLTQREIFENPTPREIAVLLDNTSRTDFMPMIPHPELFSLPASPPQRGLFYDSRFREDDYSYHLVGVYSLAKELSVEQFRETLRRLVCRHEILRTVFGLEKDIPYQKILPYIEPDFTVAEDPFTDPETLVRQWIKPFDLEHGPLIRVRLVLRNDKWLFLLDMHHIIIDGIGRELLLSEIAEIYEGKLLPDRPLQYKDYCIWLSQRELSEQKTFWLSQYKTRCPLLELPTDYNRKLTVKRSGDFIRMPFSERLSDDIKHFSMELGASVYEVFLSAAFILLSRHSGQEDIVIGSAFGGRTNRSTATMPGMFANTLPLRGYPMRDKHYRAFLEEVKELSLRGQENQEYFFETLVQDLQIRRDPMRNPLFDVMLVMQNGATGTYGSGKLQLQPVREFYFGTTFDLTFNIEEDGDCYCLSLQYSKDLFKDSTARLYLEHFCALLEDMIRDPERRIGELSMISKEEEALLTSFRGADGWYDADKTISQLFEQQVRKDPDAIAIVCEDRHITYRELNRRANILASRLREMGIGPEIAVALLIPQSIERFIGIYGVLKAGGAYIPIDPNYPRERIQYILTDSCAQVLLTTKSADEWAISTIDLTQEELLVGNGLDLPQSATAHNLAYCIYTSGTTGKPKGVMVEHQGVSNLKSYFESILGITSEDRILQFANYVFDGSVWEMNMALLTGARLILVTDQMDPDKISHTMEREGVTVASFPPNLFVQLKDISPRILVTAGSASDRGIVEQAAHCRYINSYGPTECTVAVTHWERTTDVSFVPIGKPIPNKTVYILRGDQPCALGVPGEICVGGVGIARGYLGQEALTQEHFIPNPFGEGVLYRTGDKGLFMPDGQIRFLGRIDDQVKIRGYRVEPSEVEACLRALPYVMNCAVIVGQDLVGENALFAYVVTKGKCSFEVLRQELRKQLPDYMIPAYFMELEQIPVTVNGKVDKGQLPQITIHSESEYIPPRNPKEKILIDAMEYVLGIGSISIKDSFFELGGDSIKAIRIVSYLRERNFGLTVRDIMENETIEEIALYIESFLENLYDQGECYGAVIDTPMIRLFRHWNLAKEAHFNQAVRLTMDIGEQELRYALNVVVKHHDMLRGVYRDHELVILPYKEDSHFDIYSYCIPENVDLEDRITAKCSEVQESIDLVNGPLVKACVFKTPLRTEVMIAVHHLLIDSVSWHIFIEDLHTAVEAYRQGRTPKLPLKTASFQQWAMLTEDYSKSDELEKERDYWRIVADEIPNGKLKQFSWEEGNVKQVTISLNSAQTEQLITEACNTYHTQINDLLLGAMSLTIRELTGQKQVIMCLEGHGREPIHVSVDTDRTIGWFTCAYPVLLSCTDSVAEAIIETKEMLRKVPNRGLGFGLLYPPSILDDISIYFNYIGQSQEVGSVGETTGKENDVGGPINFNGGIFDGCLTFQITGGRGWTPRINLAAIGEAYRKHLIKIIDHCLNAEESYLTYADVDAEDLEDEDFDEISALLGLTE